MEKQKHCDNFFRFGFGFIGNFTNFQGKLKIFPFPKNSEKKLSCLNQKTLEKSNKA